MEGEGRKVKKGIEIVLVLLIDILEKEGRLGLGFVRI